MSAYCRIILLVLLLCAGQIVYGNTNTCSRFCSGLGYSEFTPGKSCADICQTNKATRGNSGFYWITNSTFNESVQVYCDMELSCGGHKGGWMRVADLVINAGSPCPSEWVNVTLNSIQMCQPLSNTPGCYVNVKYAKVCGQPRGYQKGIPGGFSGGRSIANGYADGPSITIHARTSSK